MRTEVGSEWSRRLPVLLFAALAVSGAAGCADRGTQDIALVPDSLMVLRPMPDIRGRAVCSGDSVATRLAGVVIASCEFGDGLELRVHGDTIFAVERSLSPPAPDSGVTLLDYWNRNLRDEWEARLRRRPDNLGQQGPEGGDHFEATWHDSTGVRHIITLARPSGTPLTMTYLVIDCRERDRSKRAIACW